MSQLQQNLPISNETPSLASLSLQTGPVWEAISGTVSPLLYDSSSSVFELPLNFLIDSGLPCDKKMILYCRPQFHDQMKFMSSIVEQGGLGWIVGPPGDGKSSTALAFVSTIHTSEWTVLWISISRTSAYRAIRISAGVKMASVFEVEDMRHYLDYSNTMRQILVLDGFVQNFSPHQSIYAKCQAWRTRNEANRRLFIVSSMSTRGRTKIEHDKLGGIKEHFVESWRLEEFLEAVKCDDLYENVKEKLDVPTFLQSTSYSNMPPLVSPTQKVEEFTREQLVELKFYFAGGCSRFMFRYQTEEVVSSLKDAVEAVTDLGLYVRGVIGDQSLDVVNTLFTRYKDPGNIRIVQLVSAFACELVSNNKGPDFIANVAQSLIHTLNPSMKGWFYEMWVFAKLRTTGLDYRIKGRLFGGTHRWKNASIVTVDPLNIPPIQYSGIQWYKPMKWNQGRYDGFYFNEKNKELTVLQIFIGLTHDIKMKYFVELVQSFRKVTLIKSLSILCVVPDERSRSISTIEDANLLHSLRLGWNARNAQTKLQFCVVNWPIAIE